MTAAEPTMGRRSLLAASAGAAAAAAAPGVLAQGDDTDAESYLSDANNYDGIVDRTGEDAVTVDVGAGQNGLAFGPAGVRVSPGTTVTWEWTGEGGRHNVVANDGSFDSGETVGEAGTTFEHTFESEGTYTYICVPHESVGMLGAIVVGEGGGDGSGGSGGDGTDGSDGAGGSGGDGGGQGGGGDVATGGGDESVGALTFGAVAALFLFPVAFALALLGRELFGNSDERGRTHS